MRRVQWQPNVMPAVSSSGRAASIPLGSITSVLWVMSATNLITSLMSESLKLSVQVCCANTLTTGDTLRIRTAIIFLNTLFLKALRTYRTQRWRQDKQRLLESTAQTKLMAEPTSLILNMVTELNLRQHEVSYYLEKTDNRDVILK